MDFPPIGFTRRRPATFDLDTVRRLFLVHWLIPEPLHHPMSSRSVLRDGLCSAIEDAGAYMPALCECIACVKLGAREGTTSPLSRSQPRTNLPGERSFYSMASGARPTGYGKFPRSSARLSFEQKGGPDQRASRGHLLRSHQITSAAGSCC
jgi:hypothetical protein